MARKFFSAIGCPGCGCGGFMAGAAIAATLMSSAHLDPDSKSWAMLFYGGIPGGIVGAIVFYMLLAMWRDD